MTASSSCRRSATETPRLPVIPFTGKGDEGVASDAISAGVTDSLQKDTGTEQYALLANRVRNAVEHGHGDVTVTVGDLPDGFYVEDDGPGIPPDKHEHVFESGGARFEVRAVEFA